MLDMAHHLHLAQPQRYAGNGHHHTNGTDVTDLDKYQFWPDAMAMGSLSGGVFQQVGFASTMLS